MVDIEHFPMFDGHAHFTQAYLEQGLETYRKCNVHGGIVICQFTGLDFAEFLSELRRLKAPWLPVYWPNWAEFGWRPEAFVKRTVAEMRRYAKLGCLGLKVWKDLGMFIIHPNGKPAVMDDKRLKPIWDTAESLGWFISVHQGDPTVCWKTRTGLTRDEIFQRRDRVLRAYPGIQFILCHNGNDVESVKKFGQIFDRFPNVMSDIGRNFLTHDTLADTQEFLEKYSDRLLFGPDTEHPLNRPADLKWEWEDCYLPWRQTILGWGMSEKALHNFIWGNGERVFMNRLAW